MLSDSCKGTGNLRPARPPDVGKGPLKQASQRIPHKRARHDVSQGIHGAEASLLQAEVWLDALARESIYGYAKALGVETSGHPQDLAGREGIRCALGRQHEQFRVKSLGHVRDSGEFRNILANGQEVDPSRDTVTSEMAEGF